MIIVRWLNSKEYIKVKFIDNLEINFEVQEQVFAGSTLDQLNNDQRKLVQRFLTNIVSISNYRYYVIELRTPYIENGELKHSLKLLNKTNISIPELVYELKMYEVMLEQRNRELGTIKASKRMVEKIITANESVVEDKPKKKWWKVW